MTDLLVSDVDGFRKEAEAARARLRSDPQCPQYHFTAPSNWLNDPNGLIQWNGTYHLFYQHNPFTPLSATKHWGHAMSTDLVHWTDLPIALAPTPDSCDADGIYSGCAVDDNGTPTILYSGVRGPLQMVCLATGDDQLLRWTKSSENPVVPDFPPDLEILTTDEGKVHYRDPSVWRENGTWWMIVGSGISDVGGTVLLYRSLDLRSWEYVRPLLVGDMNQRDPFWTGTMWECPQLFALDGKHVLLISVWHERRTLFPAYITGTYKDGHFLPEYSGIIDPGSHYAPQTFRDAQGRRILFGWLREQRSSEALASSDWNGAMTLPWILRLSEDGSLRYSPAPELATLRGEHQHLTDLTVNSAESMPLLGVNGDCLELQTTIDTGTADTLGMVIRRSPDGSEQTRIVYEPGSGKLYIDRERSSLKQQGDVTPHHTKLELVNGELLRLRVFLDRSVIEVVGNDRTLLSERIYPSRTDSLGTSLFAAGNSIKVEVLDVWEIGPSIT